MHFHLVGAEPGLIAAQFVLFGCGQVAVAAVGQNREGWGAGVIPRLAKELKNELPELKGFSERNMGRMIAFYREYPDPTAILPLAVAELPPRLILPPPVAKSSPAEPPANG